MRQQKNFKKTSNDFSVFFVVCILLVSSGFAAHTFYTNQKYHRLSKALHLNQMPEEFETQNATKIVQVKKPKAKSTNKVYGQNESTNTDALYVSQNLKLQLKKSSSVQPNQLRKIASINVHKASLATQMPLDSKASAAESILNSIKTKEEAQEFLRSVQLSNPNEIRRTVPLQQMNQSIQAMAGLHSGELVWEHSPNHPVQMKLELSPNLASNISQGKVNIELSVDGVSIEDRTFKSTLATLPGTNEIPDATVLALGKYRYLQLYYAKNMEQWIGIYYMQSPTTKNLQYVGTTSVRVSSAMK